MKPGRFPFPSRRVANQTRTLQPADATQSDTPASSVKTTDAAKKHTHTTTPQPTGEPQLPSDRLLSPYQTTAQRPSPRTPSDSTMYSNETYARARLIVLARRRNLQRRGPRTRPQCTVVVGLPPDCALSASAALASLATNASAAGAAGAAASTTTTAAASSAAVKGETSNTIHPQAQQQPQQPQQQPKQQEETFSATGGREKHWAIRPRHWVRNPPPPLNGCY